MQTLLLKEQGGFNNFDYISVILETVALNKTT
jgi:hypothetical protein